MKKKTMERIVEIINDQSKNILDIYFELYSKCLHEQDNPEEILQFILEKTQLKTFSIEGAPEYVSESFAVEIENKYLEEVNDYIQLLTKRNLSEKDFYSRLYSQIFNSDFYPNETGIHSILLYLLAEKSPGIPYYRTDNLLMVPTDEYRSIVKKLEPSIQKALFMFNHHFGTKTEEASQIYYIAKDIASEKEQIVFWSVIFNLLKRAEVEQNSDN